MKFLITTLFMFLCVSAPADEYRFRCRGEVTGLCDVVYDKDGKETTIKIDYADPESAVIFLALQKKRIYGTRGVESRMGIKWEQGIYLVGEFTSETKQTQGGPKTGGSELYRNFRMTGIKLAFPVWRFQEASSDPVDSPVFMEAHLGFASLFPQGLKLKGKQIDLNKHAIGNTR